MEDYFNGVLACQFESIARIPDFQGPVNQRFGDPGGYHRWRRTDLRVVSGIVRRNWHAGAETGGAAAQVPTSLLLIQLPQVGQIRGSLLDLLVQASNAA